MFFDNWGKQNCRCVWLHRYSAPNVCLKGDRACIIMPRGSTREAERQQTPLLAALLLLSSLSSPALALLGLPGAPSGPQQPSWGICCSVWTSPHAPGPPKEETLPLAWTVLTLYGDCLTTRVRCTAHQQQWEDFGFCARFDLENSLSWMKWEREERVELVKNELISYFPSINANKWP